MDYGGRVRPLLVLVRPRTALEAAADTPRFREGLATVVVAGFVSAAIDLVATALGGGGVAGLTY